MVDRGLELFLCYSRCEPNVFVLHQAAGTHCTPVPRQAPGFTNSRMRASSMLPGALSCICFINIGDGQLCIPECARLLPCADILEAVQASGLECLQALAQCAGQLVH